MGAQFEPAFQFVLAREGGVTTDTGGFTKFGISQKAYPGLDIANMTLDDARVIYQRDYWCCDGVNSQAVANKILDMRFNLGPGTGVQCVQKALQDIEAGPIVADGTWGLHTEAGVNAANEEDLLTHLRLHAAIRVAVASCGDAALKPYIEGLMRRHLDQLK